LKRSALTDTAGEYRFAGLPTGNYSLRIDKTRLQSQVREGVQLSSAAEVMINSQLAIGDLSQQTTVSANLIAIDNTTSRRVIFADNAGQILTTVGNGRQIQLTGRFTF
jgi:Carboxypeptidase regulatory-like domain